MRYVGLETFFSVEAELQLFWWSCLLGIPIGLVFDCFRALRILLPHNRLLVAVEDCLFVLLYAVCLLCFSLSAARGALRWFYIAGNLLGFTVYLLTAGRVVVGVLCRIRTVLRFVFLPLRRFYALICEKRRPFFVRTPQKKRKK